MLVYTRAPLYLPRTVVSPVGGQVNEGGRLACIEKKGGGRLPGTWALMLTRPKTGGWALTREWALTRDTTVLSDA